MTGLEGRSALGRSYSAIENLCAVMSPAQWRARSLCPGWTARAVAGHLAGVEQIDAGLVRWTGDAEPGTRAARNLRYTM